MYDFMRFDFDEIRAKAIALAEDEIGTKLYSGDERLILIDAFMYVASVITTNANRMANNQLKATAVSPYLEWLGNDENVPILEATCSTVTVKFAMSMAYQYDVEIPQGTRVTPNGTVFFATTKSGSIPAGSKEIILECMSTTTGANTCDWAIGTINILVDSIPEITEVSNIDVSHGGTDREDIEDYRSRLLLHNASYSTAGPEQAYLYHAKSADNSIGDVKINSETKGQVDVIIYGKDGNVPDEDVIEKIANALNEKTVRPLTDYVNIITPDIITYSIDVAYTLDKNVIDVDAAKSKVEAAVDEYILYQEEEMGRNINPDKLRMYMLNAGADTVTVNQPEYLSLKDNQVAQLSGELVIAYEAGD